MSSPPERQPLTVFVSYSHRDEEFKDELVTHLANLKRQGKIRAWQDRDIEAGTEWNAEIQQQLESAEIILLLISHYFINSDYCYDLEMKRAIERHQEGTARVIPIILKPCDWQAAPFSKLQALPKDSKPITQWGDRDEAFLNVVQGIRRAVESLQPTPPLPDPSPTPPLNPPTETPPYRRPAGRLYTHAFSTYNPDTFTGRDDETIYLTQILNGNCRILAIAGMTGIGKTALAERVVANVLDTAPLPYVRFSLDDRSLTPDFFNSGSALLRTLGEEPTLEDQKDPANLVNHILARLNRNPCRLQIDSLERLLKGNEQEGWSEFCDPLWLDLLQKFLAAPHTSSQLILTSQDIPGDLDEVASRFPQFWHCKTLQGLNSDEQQALFAKLGLLTNATPDDLNDLHRIGALYAGHPLVLQTIAEEIRQPPFHGNITRYWKHYEAEFTAAAPGGNKLDRSRLFRRRVRQRVEQALHRLPESARQMLCASAVFRRPVPVEFWYAMLPDGDVQTVFDILQDRNLAEYESASDNTLLVRQHNLIRSVAYDLLKTNRLTWETAERQAAKLWLNNYTSPPDASKLETVRGYLEAFDHYCEVEDWSAAKTILLDQQVGLQLQTWDKYLEVLAYYYRLTGHLEPSAQMICDRGIGNAFFYLTNYTQAMLHFQQSLELAKNVADKQEQCNALNNIGTVYLHQGNYPPSIECLQAALALAQELSNHQVQSKALSNLGNAYTSIGQYEEALHYHRQHLTLAQELGDRQSEAYALTGLGLVYENLGQYQQSISLYQQSLTIAKNLGVRWGEGRIWNYLGMTYNKLRQYDQAIQCHQEALGIAREIKDRWSEGRALGHLGTAFNNLGSDEQAIKFFQQHLSIAREIGDRRGEGISLVNLAGNLCKLKQYSESLANNQAGLEIFREIGDRANEAEALKNLAEVHQALGEIDLAQQDCQQALELAIELGIPLKEECENLMRSLEEGTHGR